jgi:hypothetical protein
LGRGGKKRDDGYLSIVHNSQLQGIDGSPACGGGECELGFVIRAYKEKEYGRMRDMRLGNSLLRDLVRSKASYNKI